MAALFSTTVSEPVLSGTVLNDQPLLRGYLPKSRKFRNLNIVKITFIKRSRPIKRTRFELVLSGHHKLSF